MLKKVILLVSFIGVLSCSSPNRVKEVDDKIDVKDSTSEGVIGLDKDKTVVFQKETTAGDELRNQQWINNKLEESVNDEYYWLRRCREELADERLGGTGKVIDLPEIDHMKSIEDVKEEFGMTPDGQLKFVEHQDFNKKIESERNYQISLTNMLKTIRKFREECERKMGTARVKAGLPATRYQGKFRLTDSGNIDTTFQENENSLDDAFRIKEELLGKKKP